MKIKIEPFVYPAKITVTQQAFVTIGKFEYEATIEADYTVPDGANNMELFSRSNISVVSLEGHDVLSESNAEIIARVAADAREWTPVKLNAHPTWPSPIPAAVAKKFSKVLKKWLGKVKMQEVVRLNKENNDSCCASHDFCDANMAMDEAFTKVMGRSFEFNFEELTEKEAQNSADTDLMNEAWDIAKANDFYL